DAVQFREKPEMIARDAAAEAVIAALAVLAVEAGRFLAVERAAGPIVAAGGVGLTLVERNTGAHHLRDRHTITDFIKEALGKAHGQGSLTNHTLNQSRARHKQGGDKPGEHRA